MRPKNKYILSLFIFLSIILTYNVKVNGEDIYNDDLTSFESVENNFLNNHYSTIYFSKLGNHGVNNYGTCSYVAMVMQLCFYNTYWDDNVIDDSLEQNINNITSIVSVTSSPGIIVEGDYAYADDLIQYVKNIREKYNNYFHFQLVKLGMDYFDFYDGCFSDEIYYSESSNPNNLDSLGITFNEHNELLEYYLYELKSYSPSELKIVSSSDTHEINRLFIINNVLKGHPVVFSARTPDNTEGHVMVAYDYDSVNDEIICHMGWGKYSAKAKYSSVKFSRITNAYVLHFHNEHICTDNYVKMNKETICPCTLNMPLQYNNQYLRINNLYHKKLCECGYNVEEEHQYICNYLNNTYHRQLCNCNYFRDIPHAVENVSNGIGKCVICNATINLNTGGGFIGGLMGNSTQGNFNETQILSNGIIVLSDNDVELYKQGLLTFNSNGNIEYKA